MFADPQSVSINGVAKSLARISSDGQKSIYRSIDGVWTLTISHQTLSNGRIRTMYRLDQRAVVTNPLDSSNDYDTLSTYTVVDRPDFGFTQTNVEHQLLGMNLEIDPTSIGKLFGLES
jgi:hypothetical protein